jgi:TRAP-type C4-dicarboxylate transport system substrate-binding protein
MDALNRQKIDGVTIPPSMLFEFGFGRLTSNHYLLQLGGAPTTLLLNRDKLASLPPRAQEIIRKHSIDWLSQRAAVCFEEKNREMIAQLKADPRRKVTSPSQADLAASRRVFESVVENWAAQSPHNRELLALVRHEIANLHSSD